MGDRRRVSREGCRLLDDQAEAIWRAYVQAAPSGAAEPVVFVLDLADARGRRVAEALGWRPPDNGNPVEAAVVRADTLEAATAGINDDEVRSILHLPAKTGHYRVVVCTPAGVEVSFWGRQFAEESCSPWLPDPPCWGLVLAYVALAAYAVAFFLHVDPGRLTGVRDFLGAASAFFWRPVGPAHLAFLAGFALLHWPGKGRWAAMCGVAGLVLAGVMFAGTVVNSGLPGVEPAYLVWLGSLALVTAAGVVRWAEERPTAAGQSLPARHQMAGRVRTC